jgi:hypothetical protein
MRRDLMQRAALAVHRPDLLLRRLRGKEIIEIGLDEIARSWVMHP